MFRVFALLWFLCCCASAGAQTSGGVEVLELRVTASRPGSVDIDRGSLDRLIVGDRVRFAPRDGQPLEGAIERIDERTATVTLDEPRANLLAGTRGEARIPLDRVTEPAPAPRRPRKKAAQTQPDRPAGDWKNKDENWTPKQPLLTRVRPTNPTERPPSWTGRWYTSFDMQQASEDDRSDTFARAGLSLDAENLLGNGERLRFDGEFNHRATDAPDNGDEELTRGRLDRLSYSSGGTRFDATRVEFGRFLQSGMPEFGLIDGIEWSARFDDGDRVGASLGLMPEPDPEQSTGEDLQGALFYRWSNDPSELFTFAGGYQKTLHDGDADRDLFVLDMRGFSGDGWRFGTTMWLDYYTQGDTEKNEGIEPTQILAHVGHRWDSGSSVDLTYSHFAFPELERDELGFFDRSNLYDAHNDRLALQTRSVVTRTWLITTRLGAWVDQEENGGDAELATDIQEAVFEDFTLHLAGFTTRARFETELGGRIGFEFPDDFGSWQLEYELSDHRLDGFTGDNNDLPIHRWSVWRDWHSGSGWNLSARLEAALYDDENALTASLYLQRSF